MKKIALILSGCGHRDGSEITEAVCLLISLSMQGAQTTCFAPDMEFDVKNHLTGEKTPGQRRNTLVEAARIARGNIEDIRNLKSKDFDAIAFAGGYGAALNLSNWGLKGAQAEVHPEIIRVINEFHRDSKPIAAVCIAPTLVAKVLGSEGVELTIGNDPETSAEIRKTGAVSVDCPVDDFVTDRARKVISTPAYMYNAKPHEVFKGILGLAKELVEMS